MNKDDLLLQLRYLKYRFEREYDYNQTKSHMKLLQTALKGCLPFEFNAKRHIKEQIRFCEERLQNLACRIDSLIEESDLILAVLPHDIINSKDNVILAIDDLRMGRAENETDIIQLFEKRYSKQI